VASGGIIVSYIYRKLVGKPKQIAPLHSRLLELKDFSADPFEQLKKWKSFQDTFALEQNKNGAWFKPEIFILSTVNENMEPNARCLWARELGSRGIVFFSSSNSAKGNELSHNSHATALFYYPSHHCERQIRMKGKVLKLSEEERLACWIALPRDWQIAYHVIKEQGTPATNEELRQAYKVFEQKAPTQIEPPAYFQGYLFVPSEFDFYQGATTLIDNNRFVYKKTDEDKWSLARVTP
jgi:pyridoxamine 5'-phosphate oxidase